MFRFPEIDIKGTGAKLKRLIKLEGYSVANIRDLLHLGSVQSVYDWFHGRNLPSVDNLYALSKLLNTTIDYLLAERIVYELEHQTVQMIKPACKQRILNYTTLLKKKGA